MAEVSGGMPSVVAAAHARYTLCGEPAAEARVVQDLSRLSTGIDSEVGDALRSLVLVGPFARAEGGIAYRDGEPHAADPGYELLALFKNKPERRQRALSMMAATWTRLLGAHVTIRALAVRDLAHAPATRFWFHAGRRQFVTLSGDPTLVSAIPRHEAADLRWDEAVFTLCENLTALALAMLGGDGNESAIVERMQRAVLACGDALLLWRGQYGDVLKARAEAISAVCTSAALRAGYRDAIAWIARPDAWSPEGSDRATWIAVTRRWLSAWYLDFEAERIGSKRDLVEYVRHPAPLYTAPIDGERAALAQAARLLQRRLPALAGLVTQPLDRLLRCSVALAFAPHVPACRQHAARLLRVLVNPASPPSDSALESALRAFAVNTLDDGFGHPFASWARMSPRSRS